MLDVATETFTGGGIGAYALAFGYGVAVDLTPCVYPLIPITVAVFGAQGVSRGRALFLASAYVLGMSVLYTTLGVVVAMTGSAFGAWLGDPRVVLPIAGLLTALAASMFGAFDLQLPTSLQGKLNQVGGAGPLGAFLMGLVSGLISAPCTGPALLSLLTYIAASSADGAGVLYGGSLLFTYSLGMGTLFFAVALGASLFRPGPWMDAVKSVFGIALLAMAAWFLRPISPSLASFVIHPDLGMFIGIGLAIAGVALGAVHLSFKAEWPERLRKGLGVALSTVGTVVVMNSILYVPPMAWHPVTTMDELEAEFHAAEAANKPVLIDFAAEWCLPCKELELHTFHDEAIEPRLARDMHLIKVDMTDPTDEQEDMQVALDAATLPTVLLFSSDIKLSTHMNAIRSGGPAPSPSADVRGMFVEADVFAEKLDAL